MQRACVGGGELGTGEVQLAFTACLGQSAASTFSPEWCSRVGAPDAPRKVALHPGPARRPEFQELAKAIAMQIAASPGVEYVTEADVPRGGARGSSSRVAPR